MPDVLLHIVGLAIAGAICGSFLATLAIRWPEGRSIAQGRSSCDHCGAALRWFELIPLVSLIVQHGRCRQCRGRIDPRHPAIELACACVGGAAGAVAVGPSAIAGAVFGWLLVTLAALDLTELWLPDALTLPLAIAGLVAGLAGVPPMPGDRLIGGIGGFAALWLVAIAYRGWRGRDGLGGGDAKLFGAIGLWLGWTMLPVVLLLAALTGLAAVALSSLSGRTVSRDDPVPFGALLAFAAYPAWLFLLGSG